MIIEIAMLVSVLLPGSNTQRRNEPQVFGTPPLEWAESQAHSALGCHVLTRTSLADGQFPRLHFSTLRSTHLRIVVICHNTMDPLSIIASVAGIITAVSETIKIIGPYVSANKTAPEIAAQLHSEALATKTILVALQRLIQDVMSVQSAAYASLVQIDHIVAVFSDGVLLFSDFHTTMNSMPSLGKSNGSGRWWTSVQWVRKKDSLAVLLSRLQSFKQSVDCILSLLNA